MKRRIATLLLTVLALSAGTPLLAQREVREAVRRDSSSGGPFWMGYKILPGGDTLYLDTLDPIWIFPKGRRNTRDLKKYYRLVYNFNKVYPYALVARDIVNDADAEIEQIASKRKHGYKRTRFISKMEQELFDTFEKPLRDMTYSQAKLLVKLIDREIGKSSYDIIKDYKSGVAAGFWQGVAKLFDNDLKKRYDPDGEDSVLEYLVQQWERGHFANLYYSIFYEMPPQVKVPERKSK